MVTHGKEKSYTCIQCNKAFDLAASVKRHMFIHSGVKAHTCSECEMSFRRAGDLGKHMITLRRKYTNVHNAVIHLVKLTT